MRTSIWYKFRVLCPCGEEHTFRTIIWARSWQNFHQEQTGHDYIMIRPERKS